MENGRRPKPFSLETEDADEAMRKVLDWHRTPELALADWWKDEVESYIADRTGTGHLSRHYAASRKTVLLRFAADTDVQSPREVTPLLIQRWYEGIRKTNPHTAKHYVVHLRVFMEWLMTERRVIASNPARAVKVAKVQQVTKKDYVDRRQVRRLLAAARLETRRARAMTEKTGSGYWLERGRARELVLYMGFDAGMRKNEISEARRRWFDVTRGDGIHISTTPTYTPKDREDRTVPLTDRFKRFLRREFPDGLPSPWVLRPKQERKEKALYRFDPKMAVERFFDRWDVLSVNGRRPHLHMMRHSFASNRLLQGATVYLVAKWLGDDEDTTFRTYGHLQAADARINLGV